jgi:hypothetical protein
VPARSDVLADRGVDLGGAEPVRYHAPGQVGLRRRVGRVVAFVRDAYEAVAEPERV